MQSLDGCENTELLQCTQRLPEERYKKMRFKQVRLLP